MTLAIVISLCTFTSATSTDRVTILIYHKFNNPKSPSTSVDLKIFEQQLRFLKEGGFNVLSMDEFLDCLKKGEFPPRSVMITIDDGYRSVYKYAYPLLKKYGFPFTVFLYMEGVGRYPDYMTVEELKELLQEGVTLGNHSYSHKRLARAYRYSKKSLYLRELEEDFRKSEERFVRLFGFKPRVYAYPYGEYNRLYRDRVKKGGYHLAFTQDPGVFTSDTDPFLIPRNAVVGSWARPEHFKKTLAKEPIRVKAFYPSYGILRKNPPETISFILEGLSDYKNPGIYITELGWLKPLVDRQNSKVYVKGIPSLKKEVNRVGITGIDRTTGKRAEFFYMILNPEASPNTEH
ncbi:MAG: polysaccharide deacetylase [Nitrospirae bacterium]|nr:MAG: polysaccharide deacetylase [Nitrospirota bacterium]